MHYYYPEIEKKTEAAVGHEIWKKIEQIVQKGINGGVFREDILPEVAMEGIAVLYGAVVRSGDFKRFRKSPHEIFLNTIVLYIRGLCTRKGIRQSAVYLMNAKFVK